MTRRTGNLAVAAAAFALGATVAQFVPSLYAQPAAIKAPKWLHGMSLKVRTGNEADFSPTTKKFGLEVFRDENNGNLIYVSETGTIAVVQLK
jgi:hypothetical protein